MLEKLSKIEVKNVSIKIITEEPGVYIFWDIDNKPLYVGKAKNLRNRLRSYFKESLIGKTLTMINLSVNFSVIKVKSELEALLLEAKLVRKLDPPYNVALKDDKHPLYIKITKEKYPKIITVRKDDDNKYLSIYGPFPNSESIRSVLGIIRNVFPFSQHKLGNKPCFYKQLGLCNPCPNEIENETDTERREILFRDYHKNIYSIKKVLDGKINNLKNDLFLNMEDCSKNNDFEQAARIRDQLKKIDYITQPIVPSKYYLENPNLIEDIHEKELRSLSVLISNYIGIISINRIECYDVAHLSGTKPTASMVTFVNGEPNKYLYRHFKIYQKKGNDDISSLKEVAERRIKYLNSWGKPDLIIVDGGKGQVSVFNEVFKETNIPIIGLAKRFETLVIPDKHGSKSGYTLFKLKSGPILNLVQRIRNEAHRFARKYHHYLLNKSLLEN